MAKKDKHINLNELRKLAPEERIQEIENLWDELGEELANELLDEAENEIHEKERTETLVRKLKPELEETTQNRGGVEELLREVEEVAKTPADRIQQELKQIYEGVHIRGYETNEEKERIGVIRQGLEEKKYAIERGEYKPENKQETIQAMTESERVLNYMRKGEEHKYQN